MRRDKGKLLMCHFDLFLTRCKTLADLTQRIFKYVWYCEIYGSHQLLVLIKMEICSI